MEFCWTISNNYIYTNKNTLIMRTQLDDLKQEIQFCQRMKQQAIEEADIKKWRKFEEKEQLARTIIYNIK